MTRREWRRMDRRDDLIELAVFAGITIVAIAIIGLALMGVGWFAQAMLT